MTWDIINVAYQHSLVLVMLIVVLILIMTLFLYISVVFIVLNTICDIIVMCTLNQHKKLITPFFLIKCPELFHITYIRVGWLENWVLSILGIVMSRIYLNKEDICGYSNSCCGSTDGTNLGNITFSLQLYKLVKTIIFDVVFCTCCRECSDYQKVSDKLKVLDQNA